MSNVLTKQIRERIEGHGDRYIGSLQYCNVMSIKNKLTLSALFLREAG